MNDQKQPAVAGPVEPTVRLHCHDCGAKVADALNQPVAIAFTAKSMGRVGECISRAITGSGGH